MPNLPEAASIIPRLEISFLQRLSAEFVSVLTSPQIAGEPTCSPNWAMEFVAVAHWRLIS